MRRRDIAPPDPGRKLSWHDTAPRAFPINRASGFPIGAPAPSSGIRSRSVWVKVVAEDGSWGLGRCPFGTPVAALVDGHFRSLLVGCDCFATEHLADVMTKSLARLGEAGPARFAQSGIDLALWDLKGRLLDQPVYRLLGGPARDTLRCYATTDAVEWAQECGFIGVKIPCALTPSDGRAGINWLRDRLAEVRTLVGADTEIMVNATMSFSPSYAVRVLAAAEPYGLRWFEEPLLATDVAGHQLLRRRVPTVPVATGENLQARTDFARLIMSGSVDILQPDVEWCGGVTEAVKIATLAATADLDVSPHQAVNTPYGQHLALALPNLDCGEYYLASPPGEPLPADPSFPGMATPTRGFVQPSAEPGFGLNVEAGALAPWDYADTAVSP